MKLSSFLLPSLLRATFFLHRSMRGRAKGRTTVMQARAPAALPWCAMAEIGAGWGSDAGNGTPRCWNRPTGKLQPASVDAGTSNHFCYHRRLVLLEPPQICKFATTDFLVCWNKLEFLLEPYSFFAGTDPCFCYHPLTSNLLP
ncbi:hypothetical protein VPH35_061723 [Triticum aestivum]